MIWVIPSLVVVGIVSGPILAKVEVTWLRRLSGWLVLGIATLLTDRVLGEVEPLFRMIGICCVLLGCMKGLVYAEWARSRRLTLPQYLVFSFFWFGMNPGSFRERRAGLSWKRDVVEGFGMVVIGTLGAWLVWWMGWRQIFVMFLPMSLGFHFGALRVLKGIHRMAGYPVRTLFPNLLKAQGIGDFWSRRWNVGYSQMMQRLVGRPVENVFGGTAGVMAVFVASGVLHELAITLPVRSGFGLPTLFFTVHGMLTVLERRIGRPLGKVPALLSVALPLGVLFPPTFQSEVIAKCLGVFGAE